MKYSSIILLYLCIINVQAQVVLEPIVGEEFNFTEERISNFNTSASFSKCEEIYKKMGGWDNYDQLSPEDKKALSYCDEMKEDVWDIIGGGCSWYCGLKKTELTASSNLSPSSKYDYEPSNCFDFNYQTAWVEGVDGQGIGEYLTYEFSPHQPRITKIIVANGYIKSKAAYQTNSRPKKLKVYLNDQPHAILNLKDVYAEQTFEVDPIGNGNRADYRALQDLPNWTLRFEIVDVYPGSKYEDTAITEIYFDGLDVH